MFSAKDLFFASQGGGYRISNSLRFRASASAYLSRTPASAGNRRTFTISYWIKRGSLSGTQYVFSAGSGTTEATWFQAGAYDTETLSIGTWTTTGGVTTAVFRDPSAWAHVLFSIDTTQATAANRCRIYVNGVQQAAGTPNLTLNADLAWNNSGVVHYIGARIDSGPRMFFDGYLAEIYNIDGQALTPSSFGETDAATGVWMPKAYTGTYGTNGFYLKFDEVGATTTTNTGYGKDSSGNANRWTTNNFGTTSTATTYDSMVDTPTNFDNGGNGAGNYPVLNAIKKNDAGYTTSITSANLDVAITYVSGPNMVTVPATMATPTSGKWYFEVVVTSAMAGGATGVGVTDAPTFTDGVTVPTNNYMYVGSNGNKFSNGTTTAYGNTYTTNDVIGVALDITNSAIYFAKNNVWQNSGDPTSGATKTGAAFTALSTVPYFPFVASNATGTRSFSINFGQRGFTYTPPSGFRALNTQNLTTPTILAGNKYFDASTWTGNGTSQTITNGGFQPDFIWIKDRSVTSAHALTNTIAGITKYLESNTTAAETTDTTSVTAVNSNGFSLGAGTATYFTNRSGDAFVGWQWNAASSNTTNTSGSITSTVRANTTSGFSVVTFTAPASGSASVGHGLGVTPAMLIIKSRGPSTSSWPVWHTSLASTTNSYLNLETTGAAATFAGIWGSGPNSSVFGIGPGVYVASNNYVAYCFAPVAGYSAFGSYTGNGSTDGPFVYLGFRPRYVLLKRTDATSNWVIRDTSRDTYNAVTLTLYPNLSDAEFNSSAPYDILSNGFKLRTSASGLNGSGETIIYAAFAENPFKISRAR